MSQKLAQNRGIAPYAVQILQNLFQPIFEGAAIILNNQKLQLLLKMFNYFGKLNRVCLLSVNVVDSLLVSAGLLIGYLSEPAVQRVEVDELGVENVD